MSRIKDTRCFDPLIYSPLNHLLRFLYNENDTDTTGPKMPVPLSSFHVLSVGANTRYNFVRGLVTNGELAASTGVSSAGQPTPGCA